MNGPWPRRRFLRLGGGTLLACAAESVIAGSAIPDSAAPANLVVLRSATLELVLDPLRGLPLEYRIPQLRTQFRGDVSGQPLIATVCDKKIWDFVPVSVRPESSQVFHGTIAEFRYTAAVSGQAAIGFGLRYSISNSSVVITMHDVQEREGYELIDVAMPALVAVGEQDGAAWLAHGDTGGSLTMVSEAKPGSLPPNRFWGKVLATLPVLMLGNGKAVSILEINSFMDGAELSVSGEKGHRVATMGTIKTHRVNGSACWDMNTGDPATTRNCGNRGTPNLLVEQMPGRVLSVAPAGPSCRLDFIGGRNNDGMADWLDGAQLVRDRMPPIVSHVYDNAFVYGILCDQPGFEKPTATFEECERIIRDFAAVTDNARQIVHLWGWQFKGKDSGYPAVNEVNPRLGGYDGMMRLMRRAKQHNCTVSLSDNYDDAYQSSPAWKPEWIARRPDGELWESRNWTGENSYILGMAKYVAGGALDRVRFTCDRYHLPETTHVDVLSYYPIRNDWDPTRPASGTKNLEARYRIVEEFNRHGVDVSSEALRYAFLGTIYSFWYMTGPGQDPFGGHPIPMVATIYRQSAVWGQSGKMGTLAEGILKMLFYNGYAHASFRDASDLKASMDLYYLMMLPWFQLHWRNVEAFRRDGDRTTIHLEGNTVAEMDWGKLTYSVSVDGSEIARDLASYCPIDEKRIGFYSVSSRELTVTLPRNWNASTVVAYRLSTEARTERRVQVQNRRLTVRVNAREPVIVSAGFRSTTNPGAK